MEKLLRFLRYCFKNQASDNNEEGCAEETLLIQLIKCLSQLDACLKIKILSREK